MIKDEMIEDEYPFGKYTLTLEVPGGGEMPCLTESIHIPQDEGFDQKEWDNLPLNARQKILEEFTKDWAMDKIGFSYEAVTTN